MQNVGTVSNEKQFLEQTVFGMGRLDRDAQSRVMAHLQETFQAETSAERLLRAAALDPSTDQGGVFPAFRWGTRASTSRQY